MKYLLAILPFLAYSVDPMVQTPDLMFQPADFMASRSPVIKIPQCPDPRVVKCSSEYVPVCGYKPDGTHQTYTNLCQACVSQGSINGYTDGRCFDDQNPLCVRDPFAFCTMEYMPVCGTNNKGVRTTYSNMCLARNDCATNITQGSCPKPPPPCVPNPYLPCTKEYAPVCGTNLLGARTTYSNQCMAQRDCATAITQGPCPKPCIPNPNFPCTKEYAPVCGTNTSGTRTTYSNLCMAQSMCATNITQGPCKKISPWPVETCVPQKMIMCPAIYDPVCGNDINGVETTYSNSCVASTNCATDVTKGQCKSTNMCTRAFIRDCDPKIIPFVAVCGTRRDGTCSTYTNECLACRDGAVTISSAVNGCCKNAF